MTTKQKILDEVAGGYSVQSGVFGALNPKVKTALNGLGQYEATIDPAVVSEDELADLASVSAMSNDVLNEDVLGAKLFGGVEGIKHAKLVGYYADLFAGYVNVANFRSAASSGGMSTWILVTLLERGLIDGVIHVRPSERGDEVLFRYAISKTESEIRSGAKSKYYPMDLSDVLRTAKVAGGRYAVTGIPSFVTELRLLAERDADFRRAIAFTVGLICGHQKSTKYVEAIAWEHGIRPGSLRSVDFRKKLEGKPADEYITELTAQTDDGEVVLTKEASEVFVSSWSHGFFKSKFSDFTDDLFNETADVALGDAWLPQYSNDHRGTSLVIVRNPVIAELIRGGIASGDLKLETLSSDEVIRSQPGLVRHAFDELPYRLFRANRRGDWTPRKRLQASNDLPWTRRKIQDIREQIAVQSHEHYRTAVEMDDWSYFVRMMKPLIDRHNALYTITDARRLLRRGPAHLARSAMREARRVMRKGS